MTDHASETTYYDILRELSADDPGMLQEIRIAELKDMGQLPERIHQQGRVRHFLSHARLRIEKVLAPENFRDQDIDNIYNQN